MIDIFSSPVSRYVLHGMINEIESQRDKCKFNVLLIIHLQFASGHYIGYPSEPWRGVHIDTISLQQGLQPMMIKLMRGRSIYQIVKTEVEEDSGILPLTDLIESLVPKAASLIKEGDPDRFVLRIDKFLQAFREKKVFQKITLQKIVEILEWKDSQMEESSSWLSKVSLESAKLKEGSTYQAAVWHKLQEFLAPLLAVILSDIDCNHNLDILASPDNWRIDLFLKIYRSMKFVVSEKVSLLKNGPKEFKVRLPFSWSLTQTVHSVQMMSDDINLEELANVSPAIKHLQEALAEGGFKLVEDYVHDLLYLRVNVPNPRNGELIQKWLLSEILKNIGNDEINRPDDLLKSPVKKKPKVEISPKLIDSVFNQLKENIGWFNQLTESYPDIVNDVMDSVKGDTVVAPLSETALRFAIKSLTPDFDNFVEDDVREEWKMKVYHLQSVAQQMRQVPGGGPEAGGMWGEWTQCVVFLSFIQNVLTPGLHDTLKVSVCKQLKKVWMTLKEPDLKKHSSFKKLVQVLKIVNVQTGRVQYANGVNECVKCQEVPRQPVALPCSHVACRDCLTEFFDQREDKRCPSPKCKSPKLPEDFKIETTEDVHEAVLRHDNFRKNLNVFFLDVLKTFCFAANEEPPEKKILESLLEFVTRKSSDGAGDRVRTKELSPFAEHGIDDNPTIRSFLLQLCLQTNQKFSSDLISDFMAFKREQLESNEEIEELVHLYMNCVEDTNLIGRNLPFRSPLQWNENTDLSDLTKLNELSQFKVGLEKLAVALVTYFESKNPLENNQELQLINTARRCLAKCPDELKTFLVKEICFKHRADVIPEMKQQQMIELLPAELLENDDTVEDIFNIAGSQYPKMKQLLRRFFINQNHEELEDFLENNAQPQSDVLVLVLALFNRVVTSLGDEEYEAVTQTIQRFSRIPLVSVATARKLTGRPQRDVDLLKIAFMAKTVSAHNEQPAGISEFFSALMHSPETLHNKFLPSMPHDVKFEVLQEVIKDKKAWEGRGKLCFCPQGHPYYIVDCTRPIKSTERCLDCGEKIGGSDYDVFHTGNREVKASECTDTTQPGYVLKGNENLTDGVRDMTLFETEFFRMLLNLGCLAGLYDKAEDVSELCDVKGEDIEQHLLDQVNANIAKCARLNNLSQDEILLLLADFMINLQGYEDRNRFNLLNQTGRKDFEKAFVAQLRLNIQKLNETVKTFKTAAKIDSEKSALEDVLSGCEESSTLSRLLRVRSRVTGDNLLQWMISRDKLRSCPTLGSLLKDITVLQELANLPEILQFQSALLDKFSGKVSSTEMETISVIQFSERLEENLRARFLQQAEVVLNTWNNLKEKVGQYGGIMADDVSKTEMYSRDSSNIRDTPAAFLFPASRGSGLCSYALVIVMIETHNKITRSTMAPISPYQASVYHLSAFSKSDLQSLLLSHTAYTFPKSGFTEEEYDVPGMERKVVERFVLSNLRLASTVRRVQYLEDRSSREEGSLTKKIDQTELDNNNQFRLGG